MMRTLCHWKVRYQDLRPLRVHIIKNLLSNRTTFKASSVLNLCFSSCWFSVPLPRDAAPGEITTRRLWFNGSSDGVGKWPPAPTPRRSVPYYVSHTHIWTYTRRTFVCCRRRRWRASERQGHYKVVTVHHHVVVHHSFRRNSSSSSRWWRVESTHHRRERLSHLVVVVVLWCPWNCICCSSIGRYSKNLSVGSLPFVLFGRPWCIISNSSSLSQKPICPVLFPETDFGSAIFWRRLFDGDDAVRGRFTSHSLTHTHTHTYRELLIHALGGIRPIEKSTLLPSSSSSCCCYAVDEDLLLRL